MLAVCLFSNSENSSKNKDYATHITSTSEQDFESLINEDILNTKHETNDSSSIHESLNSFAFERYYKVDNNITDEANSIRKFLKITSRSSQIIKSSQISSKKPCLLRFVSTRVFLTT